MKAHLPNTSRRAVVARTAGALAVAALAAGLSSCGGGGRPSAQALLDDTFASHTSVASGRIALSVAFSRTRSAGSGPSEAFALRLTGPFASVGAAQLPRFALTLELRSAPRTPSGETLRVGATSTGGQLFIELGGRPFIAPAGTLAALQRGYAEARAGKPGSGAGSSFATLGLDPRAWLAHASVAGSARVAGADTTHIVAALNAERFLADAQRLSAAGARLGLRSGANGSPLLSPALLSALSSSLRSARVDIYTGASDHLLRRLSLRAAVLPTATTAPSSNHVGRGAFRLLLTLNGLNKPQVIRAPSNPQPLAKALPELRRLGLQG